MHTQQGRVRKYVFDEKQVDAFWDRMEVSHTISYRFVSDIAPPSCKVACPSTPRPGAPTPLSSPTGTLVPTCYPDTHLKADANLSQFATDTITTAPPMSLLDLTSYSLQRCSKSRFDCSHLVLLNTILSVSTLMGFDIPQMS
jgi:hypothetical protein